MARRGPTRARVTAAADRAEEGANNENNDSSAATVTSKRPVGRGATTRGKLTAAPAENASTKNTGETLVTAEELPAIRTRSRAKLAGPLSARNKSRNRPEKPAEGSAAPTPPRVRRSRAKRPETTVSANTSLATSSIPQEEEPKEKDGGEKKSRRSTRHAPKSTTVGRSSTEDAPEEEEPKEKDGSENKPRKSARRAPKSTASHNSTKEAPEGEEQKPRKPTRRAPRSTATHSSTKGATDEEEQNEQDGGEDKPRKSTRRALKSTAGHIGTKGVLKEEEKNEQDGKGGKSTRRARAPKSTTGHRKLARPATAKRKRHVTPSDSEESKVDEGSRELGGQMSEPAVTPISDKDVGITRGARARKAAARSGRATGGKGGRVSRVVVEISVSKVDKADQHADKDTELLGEDKIPSVYATDRVDQSQDACGISRGSRSKNSPVVVIPVRDSKRKRAISHLTPENLENNMTVESEQGSVPPKKRCAGRPTNAMGKQKLVVPPTPLRAAKVVNDLRNACDSEKQSPRHVDAKELPSGQPTKGRTRRTAKTQRELEALAESSDDSTTRSLNHINETDEQPCFAKLDDNMSALLQPPMVGCTGDGTNATNFDILPASIRTVTPLNSEKECEGAARPEAKTGDEPAAQPDENAEVSAGWKTSRPTGHELQASPPRVTAELADGEQEESGARVVREISEKAAQQRSETASVQPEEEESREPSCQKILCEGNSSSALSVSRDFENGSDTSEQPLPKDQPDGPFIQRDEYEASRTAAERTDKSQQLPSCAETAAREPRAQEQDSEDLPRSTSDASLAPAVLPPVTDNSTLRDEYEASRTAAERTDKSQQLPSCAETAAREPAAQEQDSEDLPRSTSDASLAPALLPPVTDNSESHLQPQSNNGDHPWPTSQRMESRQSITQAPESDLPPAIFPRDGQMVPSVQMKDTPSGEAPIQQEEISKQPLSHAPVGGAGRTAYDIFLESCEITGLRTSKGASGMLLQRSIGVTDVGSNSASLTREHVSSEYDVRARGVGQAQLGTLEDVVAAVDPNGKAKGKSDVQSIGRVSAARNNCESGANAQLGAGNVREICASGVGSNRRKGELVQLPELGMPSCYDNLARTDVVRPAEPVCDKERPRAEVPELSAETAVSSFSSPSPWDDERNLRRAVLIQGDPEAVFGSCPKHVNLKRMGL